MILPLIEAGVLIFNYKNNMNIKKINCSQIKKNEYILHIKYLFIVGMK